MKRPQTIINPLGTLKVMAAAIITAAVLCFANHALAQGSWNWNGSSDGYWNNAANWTQNNAGSTLPQGFVNFPSGPTRLTITNNYSAGTAGYQIYFNSSASSYVVWGNSLTMYDWGGAAPKIENDSANLQTVNFPIVVYPAAANPYFALEPASGDLTFNSTVQVGNADQLRVTTGNSHTLTLNGVISEGAAGSTLSLNGSSKLVLGATNTFTGDTFANAGTLVLATNTALRSAFIRLGDVSGSTAAFLNLNGGNSATNNINVRSGSSGAKLIANTSGTTGAATFSGSIYLDNPLTLYANTGGGNVLSGAALDLKAQTLTFDGPGTNLISGIIQNSTGSGMLVKNGTGTATLSGVNTYSGPTTIGAGTLTIGGSGSLGSGIYAANITNNATFYYSSTATQTNSGVISGSGNLIHAGINNGALTLSGANTYTGFTIAGNNNSTLGLPNGVGALLLNNTISSTDVRIGQYSTNTSIGSYHGAIQLGADNVLPSTANVIFDGNLGNHYAYLKLWGHALTVGSITQIDTTSGANVGNTSAIIESSQGEGIGASTLTVSNSTANYTNTYGGRIRDNGGSGGPVTLVKNGSAKLILNGPLSFTGGITVKNGTLEINGPNGQTFSGGTALQGGQLNISSSTALGAATSALTISGGTTIDNTSGSAITMANANPENWNGDFTFAGSSSLNVGSGAVTMSASRQVTVTANVLTVGGIISGSGYNLTKAGSGTLALAGANSYSGNTIISAGTLALGGSGAIASSPTITIAAGATFDVSTLTTALTLASGQNLKTTGAGASPGTIYTATGEGLTLATSGTASQLYLNAYDGSNPSLTVTGPASNTGSLVLAAGNTVNVTNTAAALIGGSYKLISKGSGSSGVTGTAPGTINIYNTSGGGPASGIASGTTATLRITSGELWLDVNVAGAGVPTKLIVLTAPSSAATAGQAFAQQPVIIIEDINGNVVNTNSTVSVTASSGTVQGTTSVAAVNGTNTFAGLSLTNAGSVTLTFSSTGLTSASASVTVSAGAAARLGISQQPSSTSAAGTAFAQQPVITVLDQYGNLTTSNAVVDVSASVGGVSGTHPVTASSGTATFSGLYLTNANNGNPITLTFSSTGLISTNSTGITVGVGIVAGVAWTTQPGNTFYGAAFNPQPVIKTVDQYGNPSTIGLGLTVTVNVSLTGGGSLIGTTSYNIGTSGGNGVVTGSGLGVTGASGSGFQLTASVAGYGTPASGYSIWLDGSVVTSVKTDNSGIVTNWLDQSANGYNFGTTLGTGGNGIRYTNTTWYGRKTVTFNATGGSTGTELMNTNSYKYTGSTLSVFVVAKKNVAGTGEGPYQAVYATWTGGASADYQDAGSYTLNYDSANTTPGLYRGGAVNVRNDPPAIDPSTNYCVFEYIANGTSSAGNESIWNGLLGGTTTGSNNANAYTAANFNVQGSSVGGGIGANGTVVNNPYAGSIAEVLVYNTDQSANRSAIETYLRNKWLTGNGFSATSASAASSSFTVTNGITPTITTLPTASAISYGQTLASSTLSGGTATNTAAGTNVPGTFTFTTPSLQPGAGSPSVSVTFTANDSSYIPLTTNVTVSVSMTPPTLTPPSASAIRFGQTLTSSSLSGGAATNSFNSANVPGTFAFTTPSIAPNTGTTNVSVTFTPSDAVDYNTNTVTIAVSVNAAITNVIEVYGSSVAQGWNGGGSFTNGSYANGYAGLLTSYLGANGWFVTNNSTPGDTTALGIARFPTNVVPVAPNYLMIAFGLNNEGLASSSNPAGTTSTFLTNLTSLISMCRSNGFYPVLGSCYPNNAYTATTYAYIKSANLTINSWNVPSYNLLGALDDGIGDGNYAANYWSDATHPNAAGHQEYFYVIVPTLFNAIASGKTNSPYLSSATNFARLTLDASVTAPITFTPSNTMHSFTISFRVRSTNNGTIAAIHSGSGYATLQITNGQITYVSTNGSQIVSSINATNGDWHDVALACRYAITNTWLFVDGVQAGSLTEQYVPDKFSLGGPDASGRTAAPAVVDFQNWCVYRSAWNLGEAQAQMQGSRQQASMEICADLDDASFASNSPAANRAQSLSVALVNTANLSAMQSVIPPSNLAAQSFSGTAAKLTWTKNSTTESGFELERRVTGTTTWSDVVLLPAGSTSYTNSGLIAGVSYDYRLAAVEGGLRGNYSNIATVVPGMGVHQTILVDFGPNDGVNGNITPSPDYLGQYWNNFIATGGGVNLSAISLPNLISTTNGSTSIGLNTSSNSSSIWAANGILNGGLLTPSYALLGNFAVTNATEDYIFTVSSGLLTITNLDPTLNYRLRLFGSRVQPDSSTRISRYIVTGNNGPFTNDLATTAAGIGSGGYNGNNNTIVSVLGVTPNNNNQIQLSVAPSPASTAAYAYLNIMEITANHSPISQAISLNATVGQTIALDVIDGTNAPTDADGDGMTITAVSGILSGGGTVATNGGTGFTYTATLAGTNTFSYTVADTYGGLGTNTVTVVVARATPAISGVTASQSIAYGTSTVSLSGTVSAGSVYPANGETVSVTINGFTQNATITGGAGGFSVSFSTATIPPSPTDYTITYAYAGDANLNAAANNTGTALTVTGISVPNLSYTNTPGLGLRILLSDITANAGTKSSSSSPTYSITGVTVSSTQGGAVANNATTILYTPPNNTISSDTFTYTLTDGSASATATVTVNFVSSTGPTLTSTLNGSNNPVIKFYGILGQSYHIQSSTNLPNWTDVQALTIPSTGDGSYTWTDTSITVPPANVYYRLRYP